MKYLFEDLFKRYASYMTYQNQFTFSHEFIKETNYPQIRDETITKLIDEMRLKIQFDYQEIAGQFYKLPLTPENFYDEILEDFTVNVDTDKYGVTYRIYTKRRLQRNKVYLEVLPPDIRKYNYNVKEVDSADLAEVHIPR